MRHLFRFATKVADTLKHNLVWASSEALSLLEAVVLAGLRSGAHRTERRLCPLYAHVTAPIHSDA